jgi:hypothetical protein
MNAKVEYNGQDLSPEPFTMQAAAVGMKRIADNTGVFYGYDPASPGGDYGVTTIWEKPTRLRRFMRYLRLDRSTWRFRLKGSIMHPPNGSRIVSESISNVKNVTPSTSEKDYS